MPRRARGALSGLGEGAGVLTDAPAARSSSLLGIGAVLARVASLAALLAAFGAPAQAAGLAFAVIVMAGAVPGLPGGAGARELVLVPALALAHGVSAETALAFSLAVQAVALVTTLAAGAVAMIWLWLAHRGAGRSPFRCRPTRWALRACPADGGRASGSRRAARPRRAHQSEKNS